MLCSCYFCGVRALQIMTKCIENWNDRNEILKVLYFLASWYNFLLFMVLLCWYKEVNIHVLEILRIKQLWNCQIRFKNNQVVPNKMKYLKFYSGNVVKPCALSSNIHFIEFREEKLSRKVSKFGKFTKVSPRQSCSTLSICL